MSRAGFFLTFEGGEACGKSTQIPLLAERLTAAGREVVVTREPGGTPIGEQIRHTLQFAGESAAMSPETELLLFAASRAQLVREVIHPALRQGKTVLCDRFSDSTAVYQGVGRRMDAGIVAAINAFATEGCVPDVTILLDVPVAFALRRMGGRPGAPDRMEAESAEFHEAVRTGYLELARREPGRIVLVDGCPEVDVVHREILERLGSICHGLFD